jgi:hypothetical protein
MLRGPAEWLAGRVQEVTLTINRLRILAVAAMAATGVSAALAPGVRAGEASPPRFDSDRPTVEMTLDPTDSCRFFREQAARKALEHYTRDMLWACEEIARRRSVGLPLGDRLLATQLMLDTYREAVTNARSEVVARNGRTGMPTWALALSDDDKYRIADSSGSLLVLEAIRNGF